MPATTDQTGFTQAAFDAFLAARDEPAWLTERRTAAWRAFAAMDLPDRRSDEWMRTDIRLFRFEKFALAPEPPAEVTPPRALLAENVDLGGRVIAVDGHCVHEHIRDDWAEQGVCFGSLERLAAGEHGPRIEQMLLTKAVDPQYDKFAALHAAVWSGGALLYVPRGVVVDQPFHLLSALSDGQADFGHVLVVLDEGAEATLLTETASRTPTDAGLHCGAVELFVGPGARLRYVNLQNWGSGVWHFSHQQGMVERDGSLQWTIGALGARLAKVNQRVALVGEGASSQVNGTMFSEGKQHLAYHTLQHHRAPHTQSDFLYKAALQDQSRTVWRGMIKVDPAAQRTDGYQRNDNLLLSPDARADSIPGLEIEADDVRCTHGATSGRVDEELVFYAQSRGFTRKEAIRIIVTGFFQQIFDRITIDSVREALERAIARRVRECE